MNAEQQMQRYVDLDELTNLFPSDTSEEDFDDSKLSSMYDYETYAKNMRKLSKELKELRKIIAKLPLDRLSFKPSVNLKNCYEVLKTEFERIS